MIPVADLDAWAHAATSASPPGAGLDAAVLVASQAEMDDNSHVGRALFIAPTGGPGLSLEEGVLDTQTFQFRCRGEQGNRDAAYRNAETFAQTVDAAVLRAPHPTTIGGRRVTVIARIGGPPSFLATIGRQVDFVASYAFTAASPLAG
jgi:hypothetical protein